MKNRIFPILIVTLTMLNAQTISAQNQDWALVWSQEFDIDGAYDRDVWDAEHGFVRNHEAQWYQEDNAYQKDGCLVIEARKEPKPNPAYRPQGRRDWRSERDSIKYTAASLTTRKSFSFLYGRLEVRAKIPTAGGAWPAIWLLGTQHSWPANGEIDVLEYYQHKGVPTILANACWAGDTTDDAEWDSSYTPLTHFTERDPAWAERFHVWRMDWDKDFIRLYLDDELLNEIDLKRTINGKAGGTGINPFHYQQYLLLNLALDTRVKELNPADFPMKYEIDYVRVFQK